MEKIVVTTVYGNVFISVMTERLIEKNLIDWLIEELILDFKTSINFRLKILRESATMIYKHTFDFKYRI